MHNTVLTERMFEIITDHIADIEKEKEAIIKSFYADNAGTGMDIEAFFREYTATIDNYLKTVKVRKDGMNSCPLTIIGSIVEVMDIADMDIYSYHIVLPYENRPNRDMSYASCLSPMGRALLLKPVGSKVSIKTPADILSYEIKSIVIPNQETERNITLPYQGQANITF